MVKWFAKQIESAEELNGTMRILLCRLTKGFLNAMGDVLREYGYGGGIFAENGKQGREVLESEKVDPII